MAVGSAVIALESKAQDAFLDIRPASGVEWVIHNVYAEADASLLRYDGADTLVLDTSPVGGQWWSNMQLHVTYGQYLRVEQLNSSSRVVGYDGVVMKE